MTVLKSTLPCQCRERVVNGSWGFVFLWQSLKPTERRYGFKRIRWKDKQIRGFKCGIGERMSSYMVLVIPMSPQRRGKGVEEVEGGLDLNWAAVEGRNVYASCVSSRCCCTRGGGGQQLVCESALPNTTWSHLLPLQRPEHPGDPAEVSQSQAQGSKAGWLMEVGGAEGWHVTGTHGAGGCWGGLPCVTQ